MKERSPVDVVGELAEGLRLDHAGSGEFGDGRLVVRPINGSGVLTGFFERNGFFFGAVGEVFTEFLVFGVVFGNESGALLF